MFSAFKQLRKIFVSFLLQINIHTHTCLSVLTVVFRSLIPPFQIKCKTLSKLYISWQSSTFIIACMCYNNVKDEHTLPDSWGKRCVPEGRHVWHILKDGLSANKTKAIIRATRGCDELDSIGDEDFSPGPMKNAC